MNKIDHLYDLKVSAVDTKSQESIGRFYGEITENASNGLKTLGNDRKWTKLTIFII